MIATGLHRLVLLLVGGQVRFRRTRLSAPLFRQSQGAAKGNLAGLFYRYLKTL